MSGSLFCRKERGKKQWNIKNQKGKDLFFFYGCHFQSESSLNTEALFIDSFRPIKPWTAQLNTEDGCYCLLWFRFIRASKPGGRTEFQAKTAVWRVLLKQHFVPLSIFRHSSTSGNLYEAYLYLHKKVLFRLFMQHQYVCAYV